MPPRVPARIVSALSLAAIVVACGGGAVKRPDEATARAPTPPSCPDLSKADEVAAFDFAREFALAPEAADRLKAALLTSMEIGTLADRLDADLGIACAQLAHGLGNKGDWRSGGEACAAAAKAMSDARAKLGPKVETRLVIRTPACLADPTLITKCASLCDSSVPAEKVRADCEQKAGRCDGNCDGLCEPKNPARCDGVCSGACEGAMKGTCGGRCKGTCDGKKVNGACLGECKGTCDRGAMSGECKGSCSGACKLTKAGICAGLCSGTCSVELSEPKCAGGFKGPAVSPECVARCDLAVMNQTECSTPHVGFVVAGTKDREAAEAMKAAVDRSFPALLKILQELGDGAPKHVASAETVVETARKSLHEAPKPGPRARVMSEGLVRCFDETLTKAAASASTVKTALDAANAVRTETTK